MEFNLERKLFVLEVCLLAPSSFYDIHSVGQNDIKAPKNAFYYFFFVSVFSEEEPDLNNELEVSVSINPKIISYVCPNIFQNNLYPVIFVYILLKKLRFLLYPDC